MRSWLIRTLAAVLVLLGLAVGLRVMSLWQMGRIGFYPGTIHTRQARPEGGFHWPYRLYIPQDGARWLWVRTNNSSAGVSDHFQQHDDDALALLEVSRRPAEALGAAVLVPSFPRPASDPLIYTHALDRDTVLEPPPLGGLHTQLWAMVDDAVAHLSTLGVTPCSRVLLDGYSASGMFASRLMLIAPERIAGAAVGAPGGWPMVPIAEHSGVALRYPLGVADYEELFSRPLPREQLQALPAYFYLGSEDTNDALPYADAYDDEDRLASEGLGDTPVARWPVAEQMFDGYPVRFELLPGKDHGQAQFNEDAVVDFFQERVVQERCAG